MIDRHGVEFKCDRLEFGFGDGYVFVVDAGVAFRVVEGIYLVS